MKLLTFREGGATRAGRLEGDEVVELDAADVGALLKAGNPAQARETGRRHRLTDLDLAPPVVDTASKIICMGQNYEAHLREQGLEVPKLPTLFPKFPATLVGPRDDVVLPRVSENADWEVELAFYIGRPLRYASDDEALAAIAGYTVLNDVSIRDWQFRTTQWMQGKCWERTTPVGPWLVTADEVADPNNLRLTCEVDGQMMQDSNTSDMVFKPHQIAAYASTFITLQPGDLVATGTPSGVGNARDPKVFLRDGQVMKTAVEGIGELVNRCVKER